MKKDECNLRSSFVYKTKRALAKQRRVGAGDVTRTRDLLITNQLHYLLCYTSISRTRDRPDKRIIL